MTEPIRAEFIKHDTITGEGITITRPKGGVVYPFCRRLLAAGYDWQRPLHVYRGDTLCITVKSIGEGARWTLLELETGFKTKLWLPHPNTIVEQKIITGIQAAGGQWPPPGYKTQVLGKKT
jgi:hypothetical protein